METEWTTAKPKKKAQRESRQQRQDQKQECDEAWWRAHGKSAIDMHLQASRAKWLKNQVKGPGESEQDFEMRLALAMHQCAEKLKICEGPCTHPLCKERRGWLHTKYAARMEPE
jgi:hypothetical protein